MVVREAPDLREFAKFVKHNGTHFPAGSSKLYSFIFSDRIFDSRVEGRIPSLVAAPTVPTAGLVLRPRLAAITLRSSMADLRKAAGGWVQALESRGALRRHGDETLVRRRGGCLVATNEVTYCTRLLNHYPTPSLREELSRSMNPPGELPPPCLSLSGRLTASRTLRN